jgi:hypothetical protein
MTKDRSGEDSTTVGQTPVRWQGKNDVSSIQKLACRLEPKDQEQKKKRLHIMEATYQRTYAAITTPRRPAVSAPLSYARWWSVTSLWRWRLDDEVPAANGGVESMWRRRPDDRCGSRILGQRYQYKLFVITMWLLVNE